MTSALAWERSGLIRTMSSTLPPPLLSAGAHQGALGTAADLTHPGRLGAARPLLDTGRERPSGGRHCSGLCKVIHQDGLSGPSRPGRQTAIRPSRAARTSSDAARRGVTVDRRCIGCSADRPNSSANKTICSSSKHSVCLGQCPGVGSGGCLAAADGQRLKTPGRTSPASTAPARMRKGPATRSARGTPVASCRNGA
jgi:hypothetical protein